MTLFFVMFVFGYFGLNLAGKTGGFHLVGLFYALFYSGGVGGAVALYHHLGGA